MKDSTEIILEGSRFWFQKVLVPIMVCIGVTGNTVTVMVLTRRRMRSSTNIYLSALAIADIIHLFFVFLLSFKHYNNINDRKYELYWRFYGLSHWLCDAASSTSVWLTVSFTIERYIAVCHPMKGKYFCTENRAKTVIVIVYIFCILTTASTTFEYQLSMNDMENCTECKIDTKKLSNEDMATNLNATSSNLDGRATTHFVPNNIILAKENTSDTNQNQSTIKVFNDPHLTTVLKNILSNCTTNHPHIIYVYPQLLNITDDKSKNSGAKIETLSNMTIVHNYLNDSGQEDDNKDTSSSVFEGMSAGGGTGDANNGTAVTIKHCCTKRLWIDVESTNLGKNETYTSFMYWYSALFFGLFPLVLIATFNCFLIRAVYISQKKRRAMTNSKKVKSQDAVSSHNENRITLMLISVVVMFLICQTPTASFLIYSNFYPPTTPSKRNIHNTLGNVFNFLITVNASCNFLLYSTMSKKFRSTFKKLFLDRGKNKRQDTIVMSSSKSNSQKFNPYHHGIKRNPTEYHTPRNLEVTIYFFNKGKYVNTYRLNVGIGVDIN
ncbi:proctolin receptor isoform X2 [Rhynchophorus ferrugineus]|uniref:proctolin receptor isoform X2 n=1 Tax=Rhynchophorus ferrugineus TaxID=354439 RepID=UPI003FCCA8F9